MLKNYLLLAFIFLSFSSFGQVDKIPTIVTKVYDDLFINLSITKKIEKPDLVFITNDNQMIITYQPNQNGGKSKLLIGSEFVSLIRTFEADSMNALAFVMGHEMAHIFLEQSDQIERIGGGYADRTLKKEINQLRDSLYTNLFERQADEWAMFYSHLGGYKTTHLGEKILDKVYLNFKLSNKLKGYPDLKERKIIASSSALKMKLLLERFELANLSLFSNHYDIASNLYNAILKEGFKSSEIYNNLGVCYLLKVINSDSIYQKYAWPLYVDSKSKMSSSNQRDLDGIDVKDCLNKAIEYFKIASDNVNYKVSFLNIAIAHILFDISKEEKEIDHLSEFTYYINKVKNKLPHAITLNGIFANYTGRVEESKSILLDDSVSNSISKRNYKLLFEKSNSSSTIVNPLFDLLNSKENLVELFFDAKGIIRDSSNYGSKPRLPYFSTISIDTKNTSTMSCTRIFDKSLSTKLYIAKMINNYDNITEQLLEDYSDFVFITNLYKFYIFNEWIIRIDMNGLKTIFKTK